MRNYEVYTVKPVTASDGTVTTKTAKIIGRLIAIAYIKTDYADTVDFTITGNDTGQTLWTQVDHTASKQVHPRAATHSTVGVASKYDTTDNEPVETPPALFDEQIKVVLAQGGDTKTGEFRFLVEV